MSMDRGLREKLWAAAGEKAVVPPRLFDSCLLSLLQLPCSSAVAAGSRKTRTKTKMGKCEACGGVGFVVCGECDGSRKVFHDGPGRCGGCYENGQEDKHLS
ncbi:hypothetical protein BRADI_1g66455v3 [Brachypodium distachyon]|uniref:Uncharacterized protein n=1 Tax=Brachypodium distachyon TaxID=15368 RepID=A0A0Q3HI71_BRADI|nr:hypothetical protein BRADI_1g66455v3 [Brachypodium distachyon]